MTKKNVTLPWNPELVPYKEQRRIVMKYLDMTAAELDHRLQAVSIIELLDRAYRTTAKDVKKTVPDFAR